MPLPPEQRAGHNATVQRLRADLGDDGFALAWATGRALPLDQALTLALSDTPPTP